jgi:hypothetical protein
MVVIGDTGVGKVRLKTIFFFITTKPYLLWFVKSCLLLQFVDRRFSSVSLRWSSCTILAMYAVNDLLYTVALLNFSVMQTLISIK